MFLKHCLQNETWLYRYLIEDNPRPYFTNYDPVHVLKKASRIQYLHLKSFLKTIFISSQCWKADFFLLCNLEPSFLNLTPSSLFTKFLKVLLIVSREWNKHVFLEFQKCFISQISLNLLTVILCNHLFPDSTGFCISQLAFLVICNLIRIKYLHIVATDILFRRYFLCYSE